MAKNWTIAEAIEAISGSELSKIQDIGKRFPLTMNLLSQGAESKAFVEFTKQMPEYVTVRKIETSLSEDVEKFVDDAEDKPANGDKKSTKGKKSEKKSAPAKEKAAASDDDDILPLEECMKKADALKHKGKDLWAYLGEHSVPGKERGKNRDEQADAVAKLNRKLAKEGPAADEPEEEDVETANEETLESKTVKELYAIAKDMGLEPEPKKGKKYYLELIAAGPESEEEDDWDDDEEEVEEKKPAKSKAKAKKEEEPEEEDDDDWDI